jgi:hypothetical protein
VDPTYLTMHDAYVEGCPSMITPTEAENSSPYLIYDVDDEEDVTIPRHDS